jgi:hypothetical protein
MGSANVVINRPAVEAGVVLVRCGGNFADGVIAYEGEWLGGRGVCLVRLEGGLFTASTGQPCPLTLIAPVTV